MPHAIASRTGIPNPSYSDGNAKTVAALSSVAFSSSGMPPVKTTRSSMPSSRTTRFGSG